MMNDEIVVFAKRTMLKKTVNAETRNDESPPFPIRHTSLLIALAAIAIAACWWPIRMRFPFDDTYITFRYAANLAHGLGIVWNAGSMIGHAGAHTEGYTNFLLVLLLAPFSAAGCDLVIVSQIIGVVAVIVSAIAIYRILANGEWRVANDLSPEHPPFFVRHSAFAIFPVALFLLDPFIWMNAYSGLETSLFTMWLLVAIWAFLARRWELAFMLCTLAALTRPEGALMGMVLLGVGMLQKRNREQPGVGAEASSSASVAGYWFSAFVLPLVLYAGWKWWYFGNLLPNSFYVKVTQASASGGSTLLPGRGTMKIFVESVWYLLPYALYAAWSGRKLAAVQIAVMWCALLSAFYACSLLIQNEYQRFTNSIEVLLMVLVGVTVGLLLTRMTSATDERNSSANRWVFNVALIVLIGFHIYSALYVRGGLGYMQRMNEEQNPYQRVAKVFKSIPNHTQIALAWGDAGRLPYFSELRNIDPVGLNTNEIAHAHSAEEVVRFIVTLHPDLIIVPLILPKDDTIPNDSCRRVFAKGHGLIGAAYPALAASALANGYKPIAIMPQTIYDLDILADTLSPHYRDIYQTLVPRIGHDPDFLPPATTMK